VASGSDILVASDAVGMGLNLNIRRIIFSTLEKFDGTSMRALTVAEIKQIAGQLQFYILISRGQLLLSFLDWWLWLLQPLNKFFELLYEAFFGKTYRIAVQDVCASSTQQIVAELKFDMS
jgi:hypothetical protein